MSVVVSCHVRCDRCRHRAGPIVVGASVDRPGARKAARDQGWSHVGKEDLCRACTEEAAS